MDMLDSSMMMKKAAISNSKGNKLYTHGPAWLIAVRERLLEFYSD